MLQFGLPFIIALYSSVIIINTVLGVIVWRKDKTSATNKLFAFLCLFTSLWLVGFLLEEVGQFFKSHDFTLWMARFSMVVSPYHALLFFLLACALPYDKISLSKKKIRLLVIISTLIMLLDLTPLVFFDVLFQEGRYSIVNGNLVFLSQGFLVAISLSAFYILLKKIKITSGVVKRQLILMFAGILSMVGLIIITIVIPVSFTQNSEFLNLAPLYTLIFLLFTAIAILKYKLFNLRIITTEVLVAVLNIFLVIQLATSGSADKFIFNSLLLAASGMVSLILIKYIRRDIKTHEELVRVDALAESNRRLQELDKQKTEFLNIAAHQLRTPVSIIKNYVAMLQEGDYGQVSEEVKEVHKNIGDSNEWLVRLADEFLNIANLEQGRERYRFEEVNLVHLIDSVVKELRIRAESKGLKLVWDNNVSFPRRRESSHGIDVALDPRLRGDDTEESNLTIQADPEKLRNVIFNFVDNAIKYSETGEVRIVVAEENSGLAVRVIDQGIGFDIDDEKVLFQKFQRGERAKKHEANTSTGLGLYIAKMFVEGHGGRVWAKSEGEGKGSEFGFWVPLKQ